MSIKKTCFCDKCERVLEKPTDGFIIKGNIYVADAETKGGLIGNNIPDDSEMIWSSDIKETMLCINCLLEILMIKVERKRAKDE